MESEYHYPPEVFNLLVDTIPLLCKSKKDVIIFFKGAGVPSIHLSELENKVITDRSSINKYEIVRTVLQKINEIGDSALRARREVIKRIVEFEQFSTQSAPISSASRIRENSRHIHNHLCFFNCRLHEELIQCRT